MRLLYTASVVVLLFLGFGCKSGEQTVDDVAALEGYPLPSKRTVLRANVVIGDQTTWKYIIPDRPPQEVAEELQAALKAAGWTITRFAPSDLSEGGVHVDSERGGKTYYARAFTNSDKQTVLDVSVSATKEAAPAAP